MYDISKDFDRIFSSLQNYSSSMHAKMLEMDALAQLQYDNIRVPPDIEVHIPSTAPSLVEMAANAIPTDVITPRVKPRATSQVALENANLLERMHSAFMEFLQSSPEVPLPRQVTMDKLLRGASCYKILPTALGMSEDGEQHHLHELFVVRALDPLNIYIPTGVVYPLPLIIEKQERYLGELQDDPYYHDFTNAKHRGSGDSLVVEEAWTPTTHVVRVDGQVIKDEPNPLGFVPYFFGYSGLGRKDASGDPSRIARGILDYAKSELRGEVRGRTAMDALWQFTAFPNLITDESPAKMRSKLDGGPGRIIQGDKNKTGWLENPQPPAVLARFLDDVAAGIRRSTFSPSFQGETQGVDSGYELALSIGRNRTKLGPVAYALRMDLNHGLYAMAQMVEMFDMRFTVFDTIGKVALSRSVVGSRDIKGHYQVDVRVEATDPVENDRRALTGQKLQSTDLISRRRAMEEYIGVEDADEEEAQIISEKMIHRAIEIGAFDQMILEAVGVKVQQEQVQQERSKVQKQVGPIRDQAIRRLQRLTPGGTGEVDSRAAMNLPPMQGR